MKDLRNSARRNTLAVALISALVAASPAMAQDKATNLDKITVTGSLIPDRKSVVLGKSVGVGGGGVV